MLDLFVLLPASFFFFGRLLLWAVIHVVLTGGLQKLIGSVGRPGLVVFFFHFDVLVLSVCQLPPSHKSWGLGGGRGRDPLIRPYLGLI